MDLPLDFNDVFNIGLAVRYINVILERQLHIAVTIFQTGADLPGHEFHRCFLPFLH